MENNWKDAVKNLSIEEIDEEIQEYYNAITYLQEAKENKNYEKLPYSGKYIKVYGCNGDGPEYINCTYCKIDRQTHSRPHIYFKGIGFHSNFGPYEDSNDVNFSTWDEYYLPLHNWQIKEEGRKSGKITQNSYDWNSYRIEIITLEEYEQAFNDMVEKMKNTFNKWKFNHNK